MVAGTGGASLTVQRAAAHLGADEILTVSRKDPITYDKIPQDIEIYINATPVGTFPHNGQCNVSLAEFPKLEGILDLVYNPGKTALLLQAEKQGISFSGGLPMLIAQATASAKLFLDNSHLLLDNETILNTVEKKTRNITLIGMPGCGKSTIGRRLAKFLHMKFVDTDALIERKAAMTPSEIITQKGEKAFRDLESTVIKKIGKRHGQVIAVGGHFGQVCRCSRCRRHVALSNTEDVSCRYALDWGIWHALFFLHKFRCFMDTGKYGGDLGRYAGDRGLGSFCLA